jgi:hypothetical protein
LPLLGFESLTLGPVASMLTIILLRMTSMAIG